LEAAGHNGNSDVWGFAQLYVKFRMVELLTLAVVLTRLPWNFAVMKIFDWSVDQGWNALMEGGTGSCRFVRQHYARNLPFRETRTSFILQQLKSTTLMGLTFFWPVAMDIT